MCVEVEVLILAQQHCLYINSNNAIVEYKYIVGRSIILAMYSRAGVIVDFISFPVMKAFTSAAAITIAMSQIKVCINRFM